MFAFLASCQGQGTFMEKAPFGTSETVDFALNDQIKNKEVVPGSYIVMFREEATDSNLYFSSFFEEYQTHYLNIAGQVLADPRIKNIDILDSVDLSRSKSSGWQADFSPPSGLQLFWDDHSNSKTAGVLARVDFSDVESSQEVLKEWDIQGRVWFAEPNGISRLSADNQWSGYETAYSEINQEWHQKIGLIDAFNTLSTMTTIPDEASIAGNPPIIAVLDSGTDYQHPALKDNIWENAAGDVGKAGCEGDVHGCNTTAPSKGSLGNGDVWPLGANGPGEAVEGKGSHGTHVAGLIAAKPTSSIQVGGVCPVCKVMVIKVAQLEEGSTSETPGITDDSQIRGLKYVSRFKAGGSQSAVRLVNSSFGKYTRSRAVAILVDVLKKQGSGTMIIAAASNEDSMIRSYPGALANAIGVAALENNGKKASFSNYGPWVDIAATGYSLNSTVPGGTGDGNSKQQSGTSMASPVVAGAAGLYLAINPSASFQQLRSRILDCADPSIYTGDSEAAKFNSTYYFQQIEGEDSRRPLLGSGMVNVNNMVSGKACSGAIGKPMDRVTPGCSSLSSATRAVSWMEGLVVFLPLFFLPYRKNKRELN